MFDDDKKQKIIKALTRISYLLMFGPYINQNIFFIFIF